VPAGTDRERLSQLLSTLHGISIALPRLSVRGVRGVCPKCGGGSSSEKSLNVSMAADGGAAVFNCFRATCGHKVCVCVCVCSWVCKRERDTGTRGRESSNQ
jgi:hypothetical protein